MKLLLDTSVFLWHLLNNPRQPTRFTQTVSDPANEVFLSVVSMWEILVKHQSGKLPLPQPLRHDLPSIAKQEGFVVLPLDAISVMKLLTLPDIHRDPFDRMLRCQALAHDLIFLSVDRHNLAYPTVKFL